MATIKSYTDLEQSKRLSEILPLESADMCYQVNRYNNESKILMIPYSELGYYKDNDYQYSLCAWSLTALFNVFPKGYSVELAKCFNGMDYHCHLDGKDINTYASNPVDACYEMILKLYGLNLLLS